MILRLIQQTLLVAILTATAAALFLTAALVYATEPDSFVWRALDGDKSLERADDAASTKVCKPIILDKFPIAIASVADYASEAVISINSYDYLNWDQVIPEVLNTYFTRRAGAQYYRQFQNSRLLRTIRDSYYTVSAISIRPAMVVSTKELDGLRTWTVMVPVTLRYQTGVTSQVGGETAHSQNEIFTVTVYEQRPDRRNFRGVAINDISNKRIRVVDDLDRLE